MRGGRGDRRRRAGPGRRPGADATGGARRGRPSEAEDVAHRVDAGWPAGAPERGARRAASETLPTLRPMGQLEALAEAAEDHRMVADGISGPEADDADLLGAPCPDEPLPGEHGGALELLLSGAGHHATEGERRTARRVLLRMMVKLHDLRLEARVEQARGRRDELGEDRHADAHVGRDYRPGRRGERAQLPVLRRVE